jgi:hypothetical protein
MSSAIFMNSKCLLGEWANKNINIAANSQSIPPKVVPTMFG